MIPKPKNEIFPTTNALSNYHIIIYQKLFCFSALLLLLLDRKVRLMLVLTFSGGRSIITLHCLLRLAVLLGGTGQAEAGEATLGCGLICSFDCRDGV